MPGRNLVTTSSLTFATIIGCLLLSGCTKLNPRTLQDIINEPPNSWQSKSYDADDFELAPDAHERIRTKIEPANTDSTLHNATSDAKILLPAEDIHEIAKAFVASPVATAGFDSADDVPKNVTVDLVPQPEVVNQPLRPLSFDSRSRVKIEPAEVQTLRDDNMIRLVAEPQIAEAPKKEPATSRVAPGKSNAYGQPPLPPLQIVDARHLPNADSPVELPIPPRHIGDETLRAKPLASSLSPTPTDSNQVMEIDSNNLLTPISTSSTKLKEAIAKTPPFAEPPEKEPFVAVTKKQHVDDNNDFSPPQAPSSDFQNPRFMEPPELVIHPDGISFVEFAPAEKAPAKQQAEKIATKVAVGAELNGTAGTTAIKAFAVVPASHAIPSSKPKPIAPKPEPKQPIVALKLVNASFCSSVTGFGQFNAFEKNQFRAKQNLLVYCEIENFKSLVEKSDPHPVFKTRLQGSYEIVNQSGDRIDGFEFPVVEDVARNQRKDFYVHLPVHVGELAPGKYAIQLHITDLTAESSAVLMQPIEFSIID